MARTKPWQLPKEADEPTAIKGTYSEEEVEETTEEEFNESVGDPSEVEEQSPEVEAAEKVGKPDPLEAVEETLLPEVEPDPVPNPICAWKDCEYPSIRTTEDGIGLCSFHHTECLSNGGKINPKV